MTENRHRPRVDGPEDRTVRRAPMMGDARLFRDVIASSPNAILGVDLPGHVLFWNPAAERMFGWSQEEVIGRPLPFVPEDHWEEFETLIARVGAGETLRGLELIRRHRDGRRIHVRLSAAPLRDAGGRIIGGLAFLEDITSQIQVTANLRASEHRFRSLFMSAAVGISVADIDGRFQEANPSFCQLLGYSEDEIRKLDFQTVTHPEDRARTMEYYRRLLSGELSHYVYEKRFVRKDGSPIWCRLSVAMAREAGNGDPYTLAVTEDITQRREAEDSLRQLNADLERRVRERTRALQQINEELESFSYSVSHDLRAPLRSIDGWAQAIMEDYGSRIGVAGRRMLERQRTASQRMGRLIDDLLRLSQVSRQSLARQSFHPAKLVARVWREACSDAGVSRQIHSEIGDLPPCDADPQLLRHVYSNLLSNAIKFSRHESAPRVEIGSFHDDEGETVYFVRDHGAGFNMRYADRLFQAFQRLHSEQEFTGTGIGLAIVQRIVHRHGGRVWAESELGRGATFFFTLPSDGAR